MAICEQCDYTFWTEGNDTLCWTCNEAKEIKEREAAIARLKAAAKATLELFEAGLSFNDLSPLDAVLNELKEAADAV